MPIFMMCGCGNVGQPKVTLSDQVPEIDEFREAEILTAFFGLDNALPKRARLLYKHAPGQDGMPVVFSLEIDPTTLGGSDFEVTTASGEVFQVEAATLLPANEEFELRTVLLIGEYGNYPDNPPISVRIVHDLLSRTGKNLKGLVKEVIPLEQGPVLSYAEYFTMDEDYPYVKKGRGCDCPMEQTGVVVKAVWSGGVRALTGEELGDNDKDAFEVTLLQGNGDTVVVKPFKLADLSDNDNNIDLCLKEKGTPVYLSVQANTAIDPRDDSNPETKVKIKSRW